MGPSVLSGASVSQMKVNELTFQRACVHLEHDAQRLQDGKDLNDALLDFFVKLGQSLIPKSEDGKAFAPAVAYLGSHFYDVLRKGGMKSGRQGHSNVANWARRRLGKDGLFGESVGAFAVPVNEVLGASYDGRLRTENQEKHWWLALILNPRAASATSDEDVSLLCLDSFVRTETEVSPPVLAHKESGERKAYSIEVTALSRVGFAINVNFCAQGDGSSGPLAQPGKSRLRAGGRTFPCLEQDLKSRERGGDGKAGHFEGQLSFRLDRRGAAKTVGEYFLDYGEPGDDYQPQMRLRMGEKPNTCQAEVARYLGGYLAKEWEVFTGTAAKDCDEDLGATSKTEEAICLPGVPQQETSHDCGFFILEQILRALQLSSKELRELATASSVEIAMLPWPSQQQVLRRKSHLRDIMASFSAAANKAGHGDVEALMKQDSSLREKARDALHLGGSSFSNGFKRWEAGDWDLSASPSRSRSRGTKAAKKEKGKKNKRGSSDDDEDRKRKKKKKRRYTSSSEERRSPARSASKDKAEKTSFTIAELYKKSIKDLRSLCQEYECLPAVVVEKDDLVRALMPHAKAPSAVAPADSRPRRSKWDQTAPPPPPAAQKPLNELLQQRHPPPAAAPQAAAAPTSNGSFTVAELQAMGVKALRMLCVQKGVLPSGLVEKSDLVGALRPLAVAG
eukprot:TRINITY_DN24585_c0_g1_i2.p1 TRINITY_DN24585_c0_g1~~TRINITY_DN24585_c0_g1_i2.p1  ORF type:complete len:678 (+),score=185.54 TRINITY_DN24585_c0_g1_i2:101-2134(+)